jgi:hypothetical protein
VSSIPALLDRPPLRALLAGAIDYAGLFPPAALDMASAVTNFAAYRVSPDAWALGRFVVPLARLDEFETVAAPLLSGVDQGPPWRLSALAGPDIDRDVAARMAFNARHAGAAVIDAIEARAASRAEVLQLDGRFPGAVVFVEVPLGEDVEALISAIRDVGAGAKLRSGGITREAFPDAGAVAHFILACHAAGVPFKATAGLHHPLRGEYPLTYSPGSESGLMFGYLNVLLAAALAARGEDYATLRTVLEARGAAAAFLREDRLGLGGHDVSLDEIRATRLRAMLSFGSCSFREPLDDLTALDHA